MSLGAVKPGGGDYSDKHRVNVDEISLFLQKQGDKIELNRSKISPV